MIHVLFRPALGQVMNVKLLASKQAKPELLCEDCRIQTAH